MIRRMRMETCVIRLSLEGGRCQHWHVLGMDGALISVQLGAGLVACGFDKGVEIDSRDGWSTSPEQEGW